MQKFPTLYKKTATGKIQQWSVEVKDTTLHINTGQVGGALTDFEDTIGEGKNIGRSNETTPEQQAIQEAISRWEGQKKKGYVESEEDAMEGKVDPRFVAGGYKPLLAKSFDDFSHKIVYPAFVQPKLDGIRACYDAGFLYTRTRKPIVTCSHILEQLEEMDVDKLRWDGELYNHLFKEDFEKISSAVRKEKEESPYRKDIHYHIYDLNIEEPFEERIKYLDVLSDRIEEYKEKHGHTYVYTVKNHVVLNKEQVTELATSFQNGGYEGAVVRNSQAVYQGKRSADLQKVKFFQDDEFEIVKIEDGRGKMKGRAARFVLKINDEYGERTFNASPEGSLELLEELFEKKDLLVGQLATVRFQGYTVKNHVPRIPKVKEIRDLNY